MTEWPILFSGAMVRAIRDGRKTQTRRLVRLPSDGHPWYAAERANGEVWQFTRTSDAGGPYGGAPESRWVRCPYGQPGDRLWVRETWAADVPGCESQGGYSYRADHADPRGDGPAHPMTWRPSIHMPRAASRLTLVVTSIRVERLHDISEEDARAEGFEPVDVPDCCGQPDVDGYGEAVCCGCPVPVPSWRAAFAEGWDTINGKRNPWVANPWVWVVGFEVMR